jgi:hypothetical protein
MFKALLVSLFLLISLSCFIGHNSLFYYSHITNEIENTHNGAGAQKLSTFDSSSEEEVSFYYSDCVVQMIKPGTQSYPSDGCLSTPLPYYSIWLPPDNS